MAARVTRKSAPNRRTGFELDPLVRAGLDTLDFGFAIFDRNLALVACNRAFRTLRGYPAALCRSGTALVEFYRFNAKRGDYGPGDAEAHAQTRLARVRTRKAHELEYTLPSGSHPERPVSPHRRRRARPRVRGCHRAQTRRAEGGTAGSGARGRARQHAGGARLHRRSAQYCRVQRSLRRNVSRTEEPPAPRSPVSRLPAPSGRARILRSGRCRRARRARASKACATHPARPSRIARRTVGSTRSIGAAQALAER